MGNRVIRLALVLSVVVTGTCLAQTQPPPTESQALGAQKGLVVTKTLYEIDMFLGNAGGRVFLTAVVVAVPSGVRSFALRLEKPAADKYGSERIGVIDFQELQSFSSAIGELIEQAHTTAQTSVHYLEAFYETNGEVRVGYYQTGQGQQGQRGFLSIGEYSDSSVYFFMSAMTELKALVEKAIAKLEELGAEGS